MEAKTLMVPARDSKKPVILRREIREYFERRFRGPERLEVRVINSMCLVTVGQPIPEFSAFGRLQYRIEEQNLSYRLTPNGRIGSVMEG